MLRVSLAFMLLTGSIAAQVDADDDADQTTPRDSAQFVRQYTVYSWSGSSVQSTKVSSSALYVTLKRAVRPEDVAEGRAIEVLDLFEQGDVVPLQIAKTGGYDLDLAEGGRAEYGYVLVPTGDRLFQLDAERYEVRIRYDQVDSWTEDAHGNPQKHQKSPANLVVKKTPKLLASGKYVNQFGYLGDLTDGKQLDDDELSGAGQLRWIDGLTTTLTPQIAESSRELGLTIESSYAWNRTPVDWGIKGVVGFDFDLDGRIGSDRQAQGITDYTQASLNLRAMFLPEHENRYYPFGAKLSAGYEDGDTATDGGAALSAQVVATLPWVDAPLAWWQDAWGFQRAFAPPYLSVTFTESGAEVGGIEQDRITFEAGWVLPIAEEWDVNLRWQRSKFGEDAIGYQSLFVGDLTYYTGGDVSQGVRMSFESGYRAAVGDIDSTILLGYLINL